MSAGLRIPQFVGLVALTVPAAAFGHPAPSSTLSIAVGTQGVRLDSEIPVYGLEAAVQREVERSPAGLSSAERSRLVDYVREYLDLEDGEGHPMPFALEQLELTTEEPLHLRVGAFAPWPEGSARETLRIHDELVLHRVKSHLIMVVLARDFERGRLEGEPEAAGVIRFQDETLELSLGTGSPWRGFSALFGLGIHHVAEGADHLAFVLMLLLVAPVSSAERGAPVRVTVALKRGLGLVTAFTVGHSLTLALGTAGGSLPATPVEILIALSVAASAVHALVPIFPRREAWVAAGFGLVHGLAFSTLLGEVGLVGADLALGLVAFNLGIEVVQALVVLSCLPWLLLLS